MLNNNAENLSSSGSKFVGFETEEILGQRQMENVNEVVNIDSDLETSTLLGSKVV